MKKFVQSAVLFATLCLCVGYIASPSRAVVSAQERQEKKEAETTPQEQLAQTKALFNEKCARCHGEDGRGETRDGKMLDAPNFTDEKWWAEEDKGDEHFVNFITNGKDGMPAFGKKLSNEEIKALVSYVRRFKKTSD